MSDAFLSIVIPARNEERRLPQTLEQVARFVEKQNYTTDVFVIENASQDRTLEVARDFAIRHKYIQVKHNETPGKGRAVRDGILLSRGRYRFMCDADLSMPVDQLNRFLPPEGKDAQIAIGSREAPGAVRYNEPIYRHLGGRLINTSIRLLAIPDLQDTQCGFKMFRGDIAEDLFRRQTMMEWSFDVELLYIARQRGYKIVEVPIDWYFNPESKLNAVRDALRMIQDILSIRRNGAKGIYG